MRAIMKEINELISMVTYEWLEKITKTEESSGFVSQIRTAFQRFNSLQFAIGSDPIDFTVNTLQQDLMAAITSLKNTALTLAKIIGDFVRIGDTDFLSYVKRAENIRGNPRPTIAGEVTSGLYNWLANYKTIIFDLNYPNYRVVKNFGKSVEEAISFCEKYLLKNSKIYTESEITPFVDCDGDDTNMMSFGQGVYRIFGGDDGVTVNFNVPCFIYVHDSRGLVTVGGVAVANGAMELTLGALTVVCPAAVGGDEAFVNFSMITNFSIISTTGDLLTDTDSKKAIVIHNFEKKYGEIAAIASLYEAFLGVMRPDFTAANLVGAQIPLSPIKWLSDPAVLALSDVDYVLAVKNYIGWLMMMSVDQEFIVTL
jgi:hypothetical protein